MRSVRIRPKCKTPADMIKIKHLMELKAKTNKKNPNSEEFKIITQTQDRPAYTKSGFIDKCRQVGKTTQLNITNTSANNQEMKVNVKHTDTEPRTFTSDMKTEKRGHQMINTGRPL